MADKEPPADPDAVSLPIVWAGFDETPILLGNQLVLQLGPKDEHFLAIGQVAPPLLLGSPEERRERAQRIPFIAVRTVARVSMSGERLREFAEVLNQHLKQLDDRKAAGYES